MLRKNFAQQEQLPDSGLELDVYEKGLFARNRHIEVSIGAAEPVSFERAVDGFSELLREPIDENNVALIGLRNCVAAMPLKYDDYLELRAYEHPDVPFRWIKTEKKPHSNTLLGQEMGSNDIAIIGRAIFGCVPSQGNDERVEIVKELKRDHKPRLDYRQVQGAHQSEAHERKRQRDAAFRRLWEEGKIYHVFGVEGSPPMMPLPENLHKLEESGWKLVEQRAGAEAGPVEKDFYGIDGWENILIELETKDVNYFKEYQHVRLLEDGTLLYPDGIQISLHEHFMEHHKK